MAISHKSHTKVQVQTKDYNIDFRPSCALSHEIMLSKMVVAILAALILPAAAESAQLWFAPIDSRGGLGTPDFMDLFRLDAPWPRVAAQVRVFKLYPQFVVSAPIEQLRQAVEGLRVRNIQLAIEFGMLTSTATCGQVEGYGGLPAANQAIERLKRVGADLRYIAMDEPLWFGHRDQSSAACHSSIAAVARDAASTAGAFRQAFPGVQVGDIEPIPADTGSMVADMTAFADAWQAAFGQELAFMSLDLPLMVPWVDSIQAVTTMLQKRGVPLGIIYNGDGSDRTDAAWLNRAKQRYESWEMDGRPDPKIALFQSWNAYPTRVLPEMEQLSFTHLLLGYARPRAALQVLRNGNMLHGRLANIAGVPVASAPLSLERLALSGPSHSARRILSGTVPTGVSQGVFVLRINDPECNCAGSADISIGELRYAERGAAGVVNIPLSGWKGQSTARIQADGKALGIVALPGQNVRMNAAAMPVTAGSAYTATLDLRASSASRSGGYVGLAFLNPAGKELSRVIQPLDAAAVSAGTVVTAADGTFQVRMPPRPGEVVRVQFRGTEEVRGTVVETR